MSKSYDDRQELLEMIEDFEKIINCMDCILSIDKFF